MVPRVPPDIRHRHHRRSMKVMLLTLHRIFVQVNDALVTAGRAISSQRPPRNPSIRECRQIVVWSLDSPEKVTQQTLWLPHLSPHFNHHHLRLRLITV